MGVALEGTHVFCADAPMTSSYAKIEKVGTQGFSLLYIQEPSLNALSVGISDTGEGKSHTVQPSAITVDLVVVITQEHMALCIRLVT